MLWLLSVYDLEVVELEMDLIQQNRTALLCRIVS